MEQAGVFSDEGKISVYLNGTIVNQEIDVKPTKGKIQIQSEAVPMLVKRVDLTPLNHHSTALKQ